MNSKNYNYSLKNIPIPDRKTYTLSLIDKIESFIKKLRWKAFFFLQSEENPNFSQENNPNNSYGFMTKNTPPKIEELTHLEDDLFGLL